MQALLAAPMFPVRWRWVTNTALAVPRNRASGRVPPPFQRNNAEDLVALIFPDQLACLENVAGDREVPEHPLVDQALADCLHELMDVDGLVGVLQGIEAGRITITARDLAAPSPMALEIINARPYAFLDDGAAEERRTLAINQPRHLDPADAAAIGKLDPEAIARVKEEAWPQAATVDELHDALLVLGFVTAEEGEGAGWDRLMARLQEQRRATTLCIAPARRSYKGDDGGIEFDGRFDEGDDGGIAHAMYRDVRVPREAGCRERPVRSCKGDDGDIVSDGRSDEGDDGDIVFDGRSSDANDRGRSALQARSGTLENGASLWVAAERLHHSLALYGDARLDPVIEPTEPVPVDRTEALTELLRSRLEGLGPVTVAELNAPLGLPSSEVDMSLLALQQEGFAIQGAFTQTAETEWCERGLLARINRYTVRQLRNEIEPVSPADLMRFLFHWHGLDEPAEGEAALERSLQQLEGIPLAAASWERDILPVRIGDFTTGQLDSLCQSGKFVWLRLLAPAPARTTGTRTRR